MCLIRSELKNAELINYSEKFLDVFFVDSGRNLCFRVDQKRFQIELGSKTSIVMNSTLILKNLEQKRVSCLRL